MRGTLNVALRGSSLERPKKGDIIMRNTRIAFMVFAIAFLMFAVLPIASAQTPDFTVWDNTFLKLRTSLKGYYYSAAKLNNLYDYKTIENENLWGVVKKDTGGIKIDIFLKGADNQCYPLTTVPLQHVAGSQVQFVAHLEIDDPDTYTTGLVYIKAQLDSKTGAIKQGGTISTIAAYTIQRGIDEPSDLEADGLTITGNVVKKLGCMLP